jgi:hypothetical protein
MDDSMTRRRLGIPAEWADAFQEQVDMIDWGVDNNEWAINSVVFSDSGPNIGGKLKYAAFMYRKHADSGRSSFMVMDVGSDFRLQADTLIWRGSLSVAGGIFSADRDRIRHMDRSLQQADLDLVMDFFSIVAFKKFADALGMDVTLPTLPALPAVLPPTAGPVAVA